MRPAPEAMRFPSLLFQHAPSSETPAGKSGSLLRRVLVTLAVMALIATRKHDNFTNPQFWAEDGSLFFADAEIFGWSVIFRSYESYLHLLPRLIAQGSTYLPLSIIPVYFATAALFVTGAIAWAIQSPRLRIPAGWAGALAIGLIPHRGEVYLAICNLQWITAIGLFALAAMDDARTTGERIGDLGLLIVAGLTGPFVILALPLFAWRALRRRSTWSFVLLGVAVGCALAHLSTLRGRPPQPITEAWHPIRHAALILQRTWFRLFTGPIDIRTITGTWILILLSAATVFALWWRRAKVQSAWILFFAAVIVIAATGYKARIDTWAATEQYNADRYFFVSEVCLVWLLAALCVSAGIFGRILTAAVLIVPVAVNLSWFIYPPEADQHWSTYAAQIAEGKRTEVPILPQGFIIRHPGRR